MRKIKMMMAAAVLALSTTAMAQEGESSSKLRNIELPKSESLMPFEHLIGAQFRLGIEGAGFGIHYLYNKEEQVSGWDFMLGGAVNVMNVYDDDEDNAQAGMFEPQIALTKSINDQSAYLLLKGGLVLGNETYEDEFERDKSNFLLGVSAQQNLIYLPQDGKGIILQCGLYQYVIPTSKVYAFDLGLNIGVGYKF